MFSQHRAQNCHLLLAVVFVVLVDVSSELSDSELDVELELGLEVTLAEVVTVAVTVVGPVDEAVTVTTEIEEVGLGDATAS